MKKQLLSALALLTLTACQTTTHQMIIAPNYTAAAMAPLAPSLAVVVKDVRPSSTALRIIKDQQTTQVPSNDLVVSLNKALSSALLTNKVEINHQSNNQMELHIHYLEVVIQQNMLNYQSDGAIELEIKLSQQNRQFSKYYKGQLNSEGPLKFDQAKIERELNTVLEQMVARIVNDDELKQFLQG